MCKFDYDFTRQHFREIVEPLQPSVWWVDPPIGGLMADYVNCTDFKAIYSIAFGGQ